MKKTYDVYSIFGKTTLKALATVFLFSVCFLGVTSEATAQTFNTSPDGATVGQIIDVDVSFLRSYNFDDNDRSTVVSFLKNTYNGLSDDPLAVGSGEAEFGARAFYLQTLVNNLTMNSEMKIVHASVDAYTKLVQHVNNNYTVYIDTEEIANYYSSLIDL